MTGLFYDVTTRTISYINKIVIIHDTIWWVILLRHYKRTVLTERQIWLGSMLFLLIILIYKQLKLFPSRISINPVNFIWVYNNKVIV